MPYAFSIKGKKAEYKRRAGKGGAKVRRQAAPCPDEVRHKMTDIDKKKEKIAGAVEGQKGPDPFRAGSTKDKTGKSWRSPAEKCGGRIKRKNPCTPGGVRDFFCFRGRSGVLIPRIAWPGANRLTRFPPAARFRRRHRRAGRWCQWRCAQAHLFARRTIPGTGWRRR